MQSTLMDSFIDVNQFFKWVPAFPYPITDALFVFDNFT